MQWWRRADGSRNGNHVGMPSATGLGSLTHKARAMRSFASIESVRSSVSEAGEHSMTARIWRDECMPVPRMRLARETSSGTDVSDSLSSSLDGCGWSYLLAGINPQQNATRRLSSLGSRNGSGFPDSCSHLELRSVTLASALRPTVEAGHARRAGSFAPVWPGPNVTPCHPFSPRQRR